MALRRGWEREYERDREEMVQRQLVARGIRDKRVLDAMRSIPRHRFVSEALAHNAYGDCPLPIGAGQTISQPYIVARMTEALALAGSETVLEIGTGSGYQAAVLAQLAGQVFTIERIRDLAVRARRVLDDLGIVNVAIRVDDGSLGWAEHAPYDRIIVTAGAPAVPERLIAQLAEGGVLVIPVGDEADQTLLRIRRTAEGVERERLDAVRFVPLIGEEGWKP